MSTSPSILAPRQQGHPTKPHLREPRVQRHGATFALWFACGLLVVTAVSLTSAVEISRRGLATINQLAALRLNEEVLLTELKDVETGQRGFLVTGNPTFLDPYYDARPRIASAVESVVSRAASADPKLSMEPLLRLIQDKLARSDATIATAQRGHLDEARSEVARGEGKRVMDAIRVEIAHASSAIDQRLGTVEKQAYRNAAIAAAAALLAAVSASLLVAVTAILQGRRSAERLRLAEEVRTLALEAANLGTWDWDWRNDRLQVCPIMLRMFELPTHRPLSSKDLFCAICSEDRAPAEATLRSSAQHGRCEWEGRLASATDRTVHLRAGLYHDQDGKPTVLRGVVQDVTARHAAERRARELETELLHAARVSTLGQSASATAHELSQPLSAAGTFIHGCEALIRSGQHDDREDLLDSLSRSLGAIGNASSIVRNLHRFLRKEAFDPQTLNLAALVREAVPLGAVGFERHGTGQIVWNLAADLPLVEGDRTQIQQIVVNLVRNAVEAMAEQERRVLGISAYRRPDVVCLEVSDSGPGLDPSIAASPFQPFNTTKQNGLGLGLSICRTIVETHRGTINVSSTPAGTTFSVEFPAVLEDHPVELIADAAGLHR